ncbi:hypothetical protein [Absidia glauca]|uniref:Ras-GEF domain-containing protein n=1 Tax=Absidia glauca TaxID=4829 RepID=A0A168SR93_ABSGL|nr:hypothetical protein [Absidia glauca]
MPAAICEASTITPSAHELQPGSTLCDGDYSNIDTAQLLRKAEVIGSNSSDLYGYSALSILPHQHKQTINTTSSNTFTEITVVFATPGAGTVVGKSKQTNHIGKLLVNFVCQFLDSWQCDCNRVNVKNKSIVNGAGLLRLDHGLDAMYDDLTTLVNAALMGYNVTQRRSKGAVPDLLIYYHSPRLLFPIPHDEPTKQLPPPSPRILLYEMTIDNSISLQHAFNTFLRRYMNPPSKANGDNQCTGTSVNKTLQAKYDSLDPATTNLTNSKLPPITKSDRQHHPQHAATSSQHTPMSTSASNAEGILHIRTSSTSDENECPPIGFIYAPTSASGGSPTKAHDNITNQVHPPHALSLLSLSLPSSRKITTDNLHNSRRGSKDSNHSLNSVGLTVDSIIDRLLKPEVGHSEEDQIIPIFIIFFRKFMNPYELTSTLIKRFENDISMPVLPTQQQHRIVFIFTTWMTDYWGDFIHHRTREQLDLFMERLSDMTQSTHLSSMQQIIEKLHPILIRPPPLDDPDDSWGRKDTDDDFCNHNKKKDSGYISSYSGIGPDSPTDEMLRLDDTIWSRHLRSPSPPQPQEYKEHRTVACDIRHPPWTTIPPTIPRPVSSGFSSSPTLKDDSTRPILQSTIPVSPPPLTATNTDLPEFAGGLMCMNSWKPHLLASSYSYCGTHLTQPSINSHLHSPLPAAPTFYSTKCLKAALSFSIPSSTPNNNINGLTRTTRVTPGHMIPIASRASYSSASVKFNTTLLLSLSNQEMAEQLTWIESGLFGKIKSREFVRMIWGSHDNKQRPEEDDREDPSNQQQNHPMPITKSGLTASISHFNFVSAWVISMIVTQPNLTKRVALLEKFMAIAVALRDLNNYNTLMAILAGISNAAILRLKQTQEGIKRKKIYKRYQSLEKLMSSDRSHCSYRIALKASFGYPCIPYLGIHSQDLIALAEGNKDVRLDGTIHWDKFRLMGECIMAIIKLQQQKNEYSITPDPMVLAWIAQSQLLTDEVRPQIKHRF